MRFRILLDNYYSYIIIFGGLSIFSYFFLNENVSYGTLFILGLLWFTDLIFEKKRYIKNVEIDQTHLKITYLNIFLQEKKYIKEIKLIEHFNYQKSKSKFNKFDFLFVKEEADSHIKKFRIFESNIKENVQSKISKFQK